MLKLSLIILFFPSKTQKLYVPVVTLSAKDNQNLCIGMSKNQQMRTKVQQTSIDSFSNQAFKLRWQC